MRNRFDRLAFIASYVLLVASVLTIGWMVEHNADQTQDRQCGIFRAQVKINTELVLYTRAIKEGSTVKELEPTKAGQEVAGGLRRLYGEVCDGPLD